MAPYLPFDCPTRVTDRSGRSVSPDACRRMLMDLVGWIRQRFGAPPPPSRQNPVNDENSRWPPPPRPF